MISITAKIYIMIWNCANEFIFYQELNQPSIYTSYKCKIWSIPLGYIYSSPYEMDNRTSPFPCLIYKDCNFITVVLTHHNITMFAECKAQATVQSELCIIESSSPFFSLQQMWLLSKYLLTVSWLHLLLCPDCHHEELGGGGPVY